MAAPIVQSEENAQDEVDGVNCQKSISNELLYSDKFAESECEDFNSSKCYNIKLVRSKLNLHFLPDEASSSCRYGPGAKGGYPLGLSLLSICLDQPPNYCQKILFSRQSY